MRKKIVEKKEILPDNIPDIDFWDGGEKEEKTAGKFNLSPRVRETRTDIFSIRFYEGDGAMIRRLAKKAGLKPTRYVATIVENYLDMVKKAEEQERLEKSRNL